MGLIFLCDMTLFILENVAVQTQTTEATLPFGNIQNFVKFALPCLLLRRFSASRNIPHFPIGNEIPQEVWEFWDTI